METKQNTSNVTFVMLISHLTSTLEKNGGESAAVPSPNVSDRVSLILFLSFLERLVLSLSRAETCLTLQAGGREGGFDLVHGG